MRWAKHVHVTIGSSLRTVVSKELGCSEEAAIDLIKFGSVYHKPASIHIRPMREILPEKFVAPGSYCRIHPNPLRYSQSVQEVDWKTRIMGETDDFVVVDKPAGIPSSPAVDNLYECVPECLKAAGVHGYVPSVTPKSKNHTDPSPEITTDEPEGMKPYLQVLHRLDISTSGVMVLGKTQEFTSAFNKQLQSQTPTRVYRAMIACSSHARLSADFTLVPPVGQSLEHLMLVSERSPKAYILPGDHERSGEKYKLASSQIFSVSPLVFHRHDEWAKVMERLGDGPWKQWLSAASKEGFLGFQQVEIKLLTGRTHQVRGQLSSLGHVGVTSHVAGDCNYPGPTSLREIVQVRNYERLAGSYYSSEELALQSVMQCFQYRGRSHDFVKEKSPWMPLTEYLHSCK